MHACVKVCVKDSRETNIIQCRTLFDHINSQFGKQRLALKSLSKNFALVLTSGTKVQFSDCQYYKKCFLAPGHINSVLNNATSTE